MPLQNISARHFVWLQPLRWWHLYSIDAPTVAVVWSLAFARAARVQLPLWIPISLGFCCWGFYLLDRLLDARRSLASAQYSHMRTRHLHHWRRRRILFPLAGAALFVASMLAVWQMPHAAFIRNGLMAAAALLYFSLVHHGRSGLSAFKLKELLVALIFTSACTVPVISRVPNGTFLLPAFLAYTALAWLNCYAIESWERATTAFTPTVLSLSAATGTALLIAIAFQYKTQPSLVALFFCAITGAVLIFFLNDQRNRFSPLTLRICADLALLTPVALLLPVIHP